MSHARECACEHAGAFLMLENTCMCNTLLSILLLQAVNVEAMRQSQQTAVGLVIPKRMVIKLTAENCLLLSQVQEATK